MRHALSQGSDIFCSIIAILILKYLKRSPSHAWGWFLWLPLSQIQNADYVSDTNTPWDIHTQNKRGQWKKKNHPGYFAFRILKYFPNISTKLCILKRLQALKWFSHANNHLLTLYEFGLDKANYHLKITWKTLWAKSLLYKF